MATAVAMHGTPTSSSPLLVDDGECDSEVYDKLEDMVSSPSFLRALEEPASSLGRRQDHMFELAEQMATAAGTLDGPQPGPAAAASSGAAAAAAVAQRDEFVVVSKEDAVEALAYYLAACIVKMPEAQALKPVELQQALVLTLKGLRKGKLQSACDLGRKVYRWSAFTYSAVQMYQNPWLVQAALAALWTFSRIAVRAAF